jgi:hypothetical protein
MILGGNTPSLEIQDERDITTMMGTVAQEESATRAWLPPRELLSLLKNGIEHINWASPHVKIPKLVTGSHRPSEQIRRTGAKVIGKGIIQITSVINGHGP